MKNIYKTFSTAAIIAAVISLSIPVSAEGIVDTNSDNSITQEDLVAFAETENFSSDETYAFFDKTYVFTEDGQVELTLNSVTYNSEKEPQVKPIANAIITVNGEEIDLVTDENGKVTIDMYGNDYGHIMKKQEFPVYRKKSDTADDVEFVRMYYKLNTDGDYVISAVSNEQTFVPTNCNATVKIKFPKEFVSDYPELVDVAVNDNGRIIIPAGTGYYDDNGEKISPNTGGSDISAVIGIGIISCGIAVVSIKKKRK